MLGDCCKGGVRHCRSSTSVLDVSSSPTRILSKLPSSIPFPSHLPQGNLRTKNRYLDWVQIQIQFHAKDFQVQLHKIQIVPILLLEILHSSNKWTNYLIWLLPAGGAKVKQFFCSMFILILALDNLQTVPEFVSCLTCSAWSGGYGGKKWKTHYQALMGGKYSHAFMEYLTQKASYKKKKTTTYTDTPDHQHMYWNWTIMSDTREHLCSLAHQHFLRISVDVCLICPIRKLNGIQKYNLASSFNHKQALMKNWVDLSTSFSSTWAWQFL